MNDEVYDTVLVDSRLKVREISEAINISIGCTWNILHECLGMRKLSARWVPRLLTVDNKQARMLASKQCLNMFQGNQKDFLRRYVTVDEKWIYYYTQEIKDQSKMWTVLGQSAPKKQRRYDQSKKSWPQFFGTQLV